MQARVRFPPRRWREIGGVSPPRRAKTPSADCSSGRRRASLHKKRPRLRRRRSSKSLDGRRLAGFCLTGVSWRREEFPPQKASAGGDELPELRVDGLERLVVAVLLRGHHLRDVVGDSV